MTTEELKPGAIVATELRNLVDLFAQLELDRIELAQKYEAIPNNAGASSAEHHRGAADAYKMAQTFTRERLALLARTGSPE